VQAHRPYLCDSSPFCQRISSSGGEIVTKVRNATLQSIAHVMFGRQMTMAELAVVGEWEKGE